MKKGSKHKKESIQKLRVSLSNQFESGRKVWNKDLTKEKDHRIITTRGAWKKGNIPHNTGKTKENYIPLIKVSKKLSGKNNPACREEVRNKISDSCNGRIPYNKGKTLEQTCGKDKAKETRRKMRIAVVERIKDSSGIAYPNYNKEACKFFKSFDEKHNTKGYYAMQGKGEYEIPKLGYFPDYINFEKKLIMEYDELAHFDKHGNLKLKDIQRQKEIQEMFPDFKFKRIKQKY